MDHTSLRQGGWHNRFVLQKEWQQERCTHSSFLPLDYFRLRTSPLCRHSLRFSSTRLLRLLGLLSRAHMFLELRTTTSIRNTAVLLQTATGPGAWMDTPGSLTPPDIGKCTAHTARTCVSTTTIMGSISPNLLVAGAGVTSALRSPKRRVTASVPSPATARRMRRDTPRKGKATVKRKRDMARKRRRRGITRATEERNTRPTHHTPRTPRTVPARPHRLPPLSRLCPCPRPPPPRLFRSLLLPRPPFLPPLS